jgi:hypothetical protein
MAAYAGLNISNMMVHNKNKNSLKLETKSSLQTKLLDNYQIFFYL